MGKSQKAQQNSQSPLLHDTSKVRCYTATLKTHCYMALLQSSLLHGTLNKSVATRQYFYKISNYLQKAQIIFWHPFTKTQILFWHLFTKNSNNILTLIYKIPNTILAPIYESLILYWQLFTKAQYYFSIFY